MKMVSSSKSGTILWTIHMAAFSGGNSRVIGAMSHLLASSALLKHLYRHFTYAGFCATAKINRRNVAEVWGGQGK